MKKVGVILSGCGYLDGSEIYEAVFTALALDNAGAEIAFFAPDKPQAKVINHFNQQETAETRNVLTESARIARGDIQPLSQADALQLDALIVPGGFGVATNLSHFAEEGVECEVDLELKRVVQAMHEAKKPMGFICIAPAILPSLLDVPVRLTIGNDIDTIELIDTKGVEHVVCPSDDIVLDIDNLIVTTPAFMLEEPISKIAVGIEKLVNRVLELIEEE